MNFAELDEPTVVALTGLVAAVTPSDAEWRARSDLSVWGLPTTFFSESEQIRAVAYQLNEQNLRPLAVKERLGDGVRWLDIQVEPV